MLIRDVGAIIENGRREMGIKIAINTTHPPPGYCVARHLDGCSLTTNAQTIHLYCKVVKCNFRWIRELF
jgi:hypothetical protein